MMRRFLGLLLCGLIELAPASAQVALPFPGPGKAHSTGGGGGVTGWCSLVPQTGLTHCYPFDTTYTTTTLATDPVGAANATLSNVTLAGSGPSANLNNAGVFTGSSSGGLSTFAGPSGTAFSIVVWVKPANTTAGPRVLTNCHTDSDSNGFQVSLFSSSQFNISIGNGTTFTSVTTSGTFSTTTWTMLTLVFSGSTLTSYVGSTASGTTTLTGSVTTCGTNVGFGYAPSYGGDFYTGQIAGTAFYNRALTGTEVTTINGL
jgi:hypothetical protein